MNEEKSPQPVKRITRMITSTVQEIISFDLFFSEERTSTAGYGFACDSAGNILFDELNPLAAENARLCLAGQKPGYKKEGIIRRWRMEVKLCGCGSNLPRQELSDARGIFVAFTCQKCEPSVRAKYRPEIFENPSYYADEPIDEPA